jgi:hypothetical protein
VTTDDGDLGGAEIVMIIEALDALIPFAEDSGYWRQASEEERQRWAPYRELRARLKDAIHMSFYDRADTWLASELREERMALTDKLHSRLAELLPEPGATRRTVREGFVRAVQELREVRQSKPRPLS